MLTSKRIGLLILILAASLPVGLVAFYSTRPTSASIEPMKGKVLRAKDKLHVRPNPAELKALRQGEATDNERRLENKIPKHLPLKVKIKRDKLDKFKDLANEHWARDLEIEVTNTGIKPIYFLYLYLVLPELKSSETGDVVLPLVFGRIELGVVGVKAEPQDVPIVPGETYTLKLHPGNVAGHEEFNRRLRRPLPKTVVLKIQFLMFGNSTGHTEDGLASPGKAAGRSPTVGVLI